MYAYTDATALLNSLNRLLAPTRHVVIGVISGYLMKAGTTRTKICLDPRSCKLLGFFTQIKTPANAPFNLGEEDKMSLQLNPDQLGVPVQLMNKIWNMFGPSSVHTLNTSHNTWTQNEPAPQGLLQKVCRMLNGNIRSMNQDDQVEQKDLCEII